MPLKQRTFRYLMVGASINIALYLFYLVLTTWGVLPQLASTIGFVVGTLVGYILNRSWAFDSRELHRDALPKYIFTYVCGYIFLLVSVSSFIALQWPHQLGQLLGMVTAACTIFVLLNTWVFPTQRRDNA